MKIANLVKTFAVITSILTAGVYADYKITEYLNAEAVEFNTVYECNIQKNTTTETATRFGVYHKGVLHTAFEKPLDVTAGEKLVAYSGTETGYYTFTLADCVKAGN